MYQTNLHTVAMSGPGDVSQVAALLESQIAPKDVVAVIAQTEGDGFARGYASLALQGLFSRHLGIEPHEVFERVPMLMIGGTAGLMYPHFTLFSRAKTAAQGNAKLKRLAIGVASTRRLLPEEYGTLVELDAVTQATAQAMTDAGILDSADVHSVQMKTPSMTPARVEDAKSRGKQVCNANLMTASGMTRGAAALGAAVALGEIDRKRLTEHTIGGDASVYSTVGCASAGAEQHSVRVIVLGNVAGVPGNLVAAHGMMKHQLDLAGAYDAFRGAGLEIADGRLTAGSRKRLRAVFVKAGGDAVPAIDGRRHTMRSDFLSAFSGHQAKAVVHGIVSCIAGSTQVLSNAGPEHQGAPGSNQICIVAEAA
ncbi:MAG: ring-opening amidohydrolase [Caldimonas sp.]